MRVTVIYMYVEEICHTLSDVLSLVIQAWLNYKKVVKKSNAAHQKFLLAKHCNQTIGSSLCTNKLRYYLLSEKVKRNQIELRRQLKRN